MNTNNQREKELQDKIQNARQELMNFRSCGQCRIYQICQTCRHIFRPLLNAYDNAENELNEYLQIKSGKTPPQQTNNTDQLKTLSDQLKQLQQNYADLQKQKQQSEQQLQLNINKLTEENKQYQNQISNQAIDFKQSYDRQLALQEKEFQECLNEYQKKIDSTTAQYNSLQQQNQALQKDLQTQKQQYELLVQELNQKINSKELLVQNLNQFVEHLTKTQNTQKTDQEQAINEKNKLITELQSQLQQLETANKQLKDWSDSQIAERDKQINALNVKINDLTQRVNQLQQQIQEISTIKIQPRLAQQEQQTQRPPRIENQNNSFQLSPNFSIYHEDDIELGNDLGSGLAATVSSVIINNNPYALKEFKEFNDFLSELAVCRTIIKSRKPNLNIIRGISLTYDKKKFELNGQFIMELADASFSKCIKSAKFRASEVAKREALRQIVEALNELHQSVRVAHLDLKPQNILVFQTEKPTQEYVPQQSYIRITDFGISKKLDGTRKTNVAALTVRYAPPEFLVDDSNSSLVEPEQQQSFKSDIWSFGCIIVEIYTGKIPYYWIGKDNDLIGKLYNRSIHPIDSIPASDHAVMQTIPPEILDIARRCLQYDHNARPDSRELQDLLSRI